MHVLNLTNAETSFYNHQVRSLRRQGVECTTITVPGREGRGDSRSMMDYLRFWPEVMEEVGEEYDLIHANFGLTAPMALTQRQLPVVLSLWGTDLYGPFGAVSKACARFCDAVVVMSEAMGADVGRECDVIPHGIDFERFQPIPREQARADVGWDDSYHVLFPYQTDRDVKDYDRAKQLVTAANDQLDESVNLEVITGVPQEEFPTYMNAADCLLLTSKREGSPNVVKEAMACNVPVVSTDVGDVRERLAEVQPSAVGETDRELVDALVEILPMDERSNGREVAYPELSLDYMGEQIIEVYERVLGDEQRSESPAPHREIRGRNSST